MPSAADLDRRRLVARNAVGDLDVDADADAEQVAVAGLPPAPLLGSQLVVAGGGEHSVEGPDVVADVVGLPDRRGVRIAERGDQVEPADLGRVASELGGEQVDRPLDRGRRLGAAGAAEGDDRRGVGDDRTGAALDVGDVVHARRHRAGHERPEHRPDLCRGAGSSARCRAGSGSPGRPGSRRSSRRGSAPDRGRGSSSTRCESPPRPPAGRAPSPGGRAAAPPGTA